MWRTGSKPIVALAAPSIATEHAPAPADAHATPVPVIKYAAPAPAVTCATPASETDYVTHSPVIDYIAPAPAVTFSRLSQLLLPAYTMDTNGLVNAQSPVTAVEGSASQVSGSLPRLDESAAPVYHHVRQEQIAAGETTQNIVEFPTVQVQVIVPEIPGAQVVERIQEQIVSPLRCFRKSVANSAPSNKLCACQSLR